MKYDESNSVNCQVMWGTKWKTCPDWFPNSMGEVHCIYFKKDHRCVLRFVKHEEFIKDGEYEL